MAAEQRILGTAFLIGGIAVVLVLLWAFGPFGGPGASEVEAELKGEIWPAYRQAEERGDYDEMEDLAERAVDLLDTTGGAGAKKAIQTAATTDANARALWTRIEDGTFSKNAEGLFAHGREYFPRDDHRALALVERGVEGLRELRHVRDLARDVQKAVDDARLGSGAALAPADRPAPSLPDNPVVAHDHALFSVFAIPANALKEALRTESPGGAGTSARLRWNRDVAEKDGLRSRLRELPERTRSIAEAAERLAGARAPEGAEARKAFDKLLGRAKDALAAGAADETRNALDDAFARLDTVVATAREEASMLAQLERPARELADAMSGRFEQ